MNIIRYITFVQTPNNETRRTTELYNSKKKDVEENVNLLKKFDTIGRLSQPSTERRDMMSGGREGERQSWLQRHTCIDFDGVDRNTTFLLNQCRSKGWKGNHSLVTWWSHLSCPTVSLHIRPKYHKKSQDTTRVTLPSNQIIITSDIMTMVIMMWDYYLYSWNWGRQHDMTWHVLKPQQEVHYHNQRHHNHIEHNHHDDGNWYEM